MKCLRCGTCCIGYFVSVVKPKYVKEELDLEKLPEEAWLFLVDEFGKPITCPNLSFDKKGKAKCGVHHYEWYKRTACFSHGQVERSEKDVCRLGEFILKNKEKENEK